MTQIVSQNNFKDIINIIEQPKSSKRRKAFPPPTRRKFTNQNKQ